MYPINAAAVIIEERMHMTGEPYSVLCDLEEMIVAVFVSWSRWRLTSRRRL